MKPSRTAHSGAECRAQIMTLLRDKHRSAKELARLLHLEPVTIRAHLAQLKDAGRIHIGSYDGNTKLYAYGPGDDAPDLRTKILLALKGTQEIKGRNGWVRIKPIRMTVAQLCAAGNTSPEGGNVRRLVVELVKAGKLHVADWERRHCTWTPMYSLGNGPAKPRPKPISLAELRRRERARVKADPERYMKYLAYERGRSVRRNRTKVKPDPILNQFAGLFGGAAKPAAASTTA